VAGTSLSESVRDSSLSATGRALRLSLALVIFGVLTAGAFFANDDAFPFGPFRMYATSDPPTGEVAVVALEARVGDGDWTLVHPSAESVGMNVAEFEGQLPRFEQDPELLGAVATSWQRLHPDDPPWTALRIVRQATEVVDRVPTGEVNETVVAEWAAP
jgi:hypothetical protein